MPALEELGTRQRQTSYQTNAPSRQETRTATRDIGMTKNVTASLTFSAATGRVSGANGTFANFVAGDTLLIEGTNLNNGERIVTGIDTTNHAFLSLNFPPQNEGPIAATVRTT